MLNFQRMYSLKNNFAASTNFLGKKSQQKRKFPLKLMCFQFSMETIEKCHNFKSPTFDGSPHPRDLIIFPDLTTLSSPRINFFLPLFWWLFAQEKKKGANMSDRSDSTKIQNKKQLWLYYSTFFEIPWKNWQNLNSYQIHILNKLINVTYKLR